MATNIICIPTLNEAQNIGRLIAEIQDICPKLHLLVIDDNSSDGTQEVVKRSEGFGATVFIIEHPSRLGFAKSYLAGFSWAINRGYQVIGQMDADFSHPPRYLPSLIKRLSFSDFVVGSRYVAKGKVVNWSAYRRLLSRLGNLYAKFWINTKVQDQTGGFNLWNHYVLDSLPLNQLRSDGYAFQVELKALAVANGYKFSEHAITFEERQAEKSKMTLNICLEALTAIPRIGRIAKKNAIPTNLYPEPSRHLGGRRS